MKAIGLGHRIRELAGSHLITMESGSLTVIGMETAVGLNMTTAGTETEAAILIGTETAAKQHHCRNHSSTSGPSLETTRGRDQRPRACRVVDFRVLRYFPYCTNTSLLFFSTLETSEMLLAIAALLIHLPTVPQSLIPVITAAASDLGSSAPGRAVPEPATSPAAVQPTSWPLPLFAPRAFLAPVHLAPEKPRSEQLSRRLWLPLTIAQHGAATFDAWSTRRVISSGQGVEENPLLKPFAGNTSLYAAIQVSPIVLDYLGRWMLKSQQGWARHAWWLPQALGAAISIASGVHNMGVTSVPQ